MGQGRAPFGSRRAPQQQLRMGSLDGWEKEQTTPEKRRYEYETGQKARRASAR